MTGDSDAFVVRREGEGEPELSVFMPVFNQEAYVAGAIASVLGQRGVVLEIIVSDDRSTDGTWRAAARTLDDAGPHPHRVITRQGTTRLRRDHPVLLVEQASAPVVMAAHGDDLAEPDRARRLLDVLTETGAVMAGSRSLTIDTGGRPIPDPSTARPDVHTGKVLGPDDLVRWSTEFTGSLLAWRPEALAGFARLDQAYCASGHDVVLPFRAALAGGTTIVCEPLVRRRLHDQSWSRSTWDRRSELSAEFGRELTRITAWRAMERDLARAEELGMVDASSAASLRRELSVRREKRLDRVMRAHDTLLAEGRVPLWVTEQEANLAYQGRLGALLAARARRWGAIDRAGRAVKRRLAR